MPRLALYQPDIAANLGTMMRLCACMNVPLDVIEPCGFPFSIKALRRSAMDYADLADITRHDDWSQFYQQTKNPLTIATKRLVLVTTKSEIAYTKFAFSTNDIILMGRESAGVPDVVHNAVDARITIPMPGGGRSLNVAVAAGMVMGEALRQTRP